MNFTQEQRDVIRSAIQVFADKIDNRPNQSTIAEIDTDSIKTVLSEIFDKIGYKVHISIGSGKLAKFPNISFCRKDILKDTFINSKEFSLTRGFYVMIVYNRNNNKNKFATHIGGAKANDINCKAYELLNQQDSSENSKNNAWHHKEFKSVSDDVIVELENLINIFNNFSVDDFKPLTNKNENLQNLNKNEPQSKDNEMKFPLNQILYGPPGTGKTYNTIVKAMEIIDDKKYENIEEKEYEALKKRFDDLKQNGQIEFITFHQSYGYEEFVEGIKPVFDDENSQRGELKYEIKDGIFKEICDTALKKLEQRYILIIDEINRGNISKIFGELITLIEESKRIKNPEELRVALPYSGKKFDNGKGFGVPKNLYIIGAMNTADRSIALIDTALRRRFEFVEMMPKAEKLKDKDDREKPLVIDGVNLQELLKAMNERIEFLLDREHTIGHAYFMKVENLGDLKQVFKNKIIPLLQEYFYDDYEKIRAVLNDTDGKFIQKIEKKDLKYNIKGFDDLFDSEKYIYKICKFNDLTADDFKKIYGVKEQNNSNE